MRRNRSHADYGKPAHRPHVSHGVGPASPLPFIQWLVPTLLAAVVTGAGLHAARVVGQPLLNSLRAPTSEGSSAPAPHDPATASELAGFTPTVQRWQPQIAGWARQANLSASLVATVMQIESCGDPTALSPAGAAGLFQVMPYHFAPGEDPFDPDTNARRGLSYLKRSLDLAGGDPALALAGYNGGHG
ncbi:MAG: lytic transglycosylase domain-containing protein, partial [Anaerolineales bacterium]